MLATDVHKDVLNLSATTNRFSLRAVMLSGRGSTAGAAFASGMAGFDAKLVIAALGLMIVCIVRKIRK